MLFHLDYFFLPQASLGKLVPFLDRAYLAVDLFFLMSGFVMMHVYGQALASDRRAHWLDFAKVRFARLYPLFALATLAMVITHALSQMPLPHVSLSGSSLALQPLQLQYLASDLSWDYPSWSIGTETAAYVYFVFGAATLLRGKHPRLLAAGCVAVMVAVSLVHGGRLYVQHGAPALLRTLAEFTFGALLYRAHPGDTARRRTALGLLAVVCAVSAVLTHWDLLAVGAFACLISCGVDGSSVLGRLLSVRPAAALGAWSYSIYLLHAPTHYAVMVAFAAIGHPIDALDASSARWLLLLTALAVLGLSALTFHYFEVPARRWILRALRPAKLPGTPYIPG